MENDHKSEEIQIAELEGYIKGLYAGENIILVVQIIIYLFSALEFALHDEKALTHDYITPIIISCFNRHFKTKEKNRA